MNKKTRKKREWDNLAKKVANGETTKQRCDHCKKLFIILVPNSSMMQLCFSCFGVIDGIQEAAVKQSKMSNYQSELWEKPLPDNFADIVKKREIKRELVLTHDLEQGDGRKLLELFEQKMSAGVQKKINSQREDVSTDQLKEVYDEAIKQFDDYPEVTPTLRKTIEGILKENFERWVTIHKHHAEQDSQKRKDLIQVVKDKIKPEYFTKIEKLIDLWIEDNEKPVTEITDEQILSAADGAVHNVEHHKEEPNGFCKECDEFYNKGSIKTRLTEALEIIEDRIQLNSKKRQDYYKSTSKNGETVYPEEYTKEIQKFEKDLKKRFNDTPQEKVDEFLTEIKGENQKIKEEQKRERELKKEQFKMKTFKEALSYIKKQNLYTQTDYENFSKTSDFPPDMPPRPDIFYAKEWKAMSKQKTEDWKTQLSEKDRWKYFLGVEGRLYNFRKDKNAHKRQTVKQILEEIEKRLDHYMIFTPGLLTNWFKIMGLFHHRDPGIRAFVRQFIETEKTPEGKKQLQEALSRTIFNLQIGHFPKGVDASPLPATEKTYLDRERSGKTNYSKTALLEKTPSLSVRSVIEGTREVVPMTKDSKWWNLHVEFTKNMIFKQLFDPKREMKEIEGMINEAKNGNAFHDEVLSRFWDEYNGVKNIGFWKKDYSFSINGEIKDPTLNQLYTAYKMRRMNGFCNFGDPGIGKTNASLIATRIPDVKMVLIIAPFNIQKQWAKAVPQIYPHSFVSVGKEPFKNWAKGDYDVLYHVVNYEKFSREEGGEKLVNELANFQIDFVVIDESHHTKIRTDSSISNTRINIENLLDKLRISNRKLKCLMLSATPVINNIREGKSILEMVTGTKYPDLKTTNNLGNATELHSEFVPFSVRYVKNYEEIKQEGNEDPIYVDATIPEFLGTQDIRNLSWRDYEQICTKFRIPEIVKRLKKKTIIYTDYVDGDSRLGLPILEQLKIAVEGAGYSVGFFTGGEVKPGIGGKGGLEDWSNCKVVDGEKIPFNPFVDGDLDVLIASSSLSEGIDQLQYVCDNLIMNGLVWTFAEYKQLIGRILRVGQKSNTITINLILARINGYDYDQKIKLNRLESKKILGNCVVDGTLPDMTQFTNSKKELKNMIEHILKKRESGIKIPQRERPHER